MVTLGYRDFKMLCCQVTHQSEVDMYKCIAFLSVACFRPFFSNPTSTFKKNFFHHLFTFFLQNESFDTCTGVLVIFFSVYLVDNFNMYATSWLWLLLSNKSGLCRNEENEMKYMYLHW